jgi:hypothetical protein
MTLTNLLFLRFILLLILGRKIPSNKFANQIWNVRRRLGFPDPSSGRNELIRPARGEQDEFVADQTTRPHRRDDIFLQLDVVTHPLSEACAIVGQTDAFHLADSHAGNFYRITELEPRHRDKIRVYDISLSAKQLKFPKPNSEITQANQPDEDKDANQDVGARMVHFCISYRTWIGPSVFP